jgi:hypothetical protein
MKISLLHIDQFAQNVLLWLNKLFQITDRSTLTLRYIEVNIS